MQKYLEDILLKLHQNDETLSSLTFEADEAIDLGFLRNLASALEQNTRVTSLVFVNNFLSEEHCRCIGNLTCVSLRDLTIQNNNISDESLEAILTISTLQTVNFSYNTIGDRGALRLAQHPSLSSVNVSFNNITNIGITALIRSNKLRSLQAEGNKVNESISDVVFENQTLQDINLRNDKINRTLNQRFKQHVESRPSNDVDKRPQRGGFFQDEEPRAPMDEKKDAKSNSKWCFVL